MSSSRPFGFPSRGCAVEYLRVRAAVLNGDLVGVDPLLEVTKVRRHHHLHESRRGKQAPER